MAEEALTASEAARLVGVAVTTLRTWDRRYGLGPLGHDAGKHRRYGPEDLRRLAEMQRLVGQGVPPARAAAWVLGRTIPAARRDGGGYAVAVGSAGPAVRGLTRAALRLDSAELRQVIAETLNRDGVVTAWTDLLAPALIHIGRKHAATEALVEVEHLMSREVSVGLARVERPVGAARVLLACTDEEQHSLALEALAAALAEAGVPSRLLGARVPPSALREALRRAGPDIVVLWSQTAATAHLGQLADALDARPAPKLVLAAGPGWAETQLPETVQRPDSLAEAVDLVTGRHPTAASPSGVRR
ncbi:MAG: MerR family transcriptional regulator [Hamadaea sp.]|nr:MerR family transcriptional regulator [Hamadaea sp.]NUT08457.1 MerR family transcriptional regulator [Hamadaea sp.]